MFEGMERVELFVVGAQILKGSRFEVLERAELFVVGVQLLKESRFEVRQGSRALFPT